jgi:hypothetical protein
MILLKATNELLTRPKRQSILRPTSVPHAEHPRPIIPLPTHIPGNSAGTAAVPTFVQLQQHQTAPKPHNITVTDFIRTSSLRQKLEFDANLLITEKSKALQQGDPSAQSCLTVLLQVCFEE